MKRIFFLRGWLMPALLMLALPVLAQVVAPPAKPDKGRDDNQHPVDTAKLALGEALYQQGRFKEAESLFGYIRRYDKQDKSAPDYVAALYYEALCQHALGDWSGYLATAGSPWMQKTDLPDEMRQNLALRAVDALNGLTNREEFLRVVQAPWFQKADIPAAARETVDFKELDALLANRSFEGLLPKITAFQASHADSRRLWTVAEYQLAAFYEYGMKNMENVHFSKGSVATNLLEAGQANLKNFLQLAAALNEPNYVNLPQRKLQDDIMKANAALGNEASAMQSLSAADKERAAFYSLEILCKLQPRAVDEHLARMTNFFNDFPNSQHRARVRYEVGMAALEESSHGVRCDVYRKVAQELLRDTEVDQAAGVSEADVQEAQGGILRSYYDERDYAKLSGWAAQMISNSVPGGKPWVVAKLYDGAGLFCHGKLPEAASELDELLALGFKGNPSDDGHVVAAANWRITIAECDEDETTARQVAQLVQNSKCYGSIKRTFMKRHADLITQ